MFKEDQSFVFIIDLMMNNKVETH